MGRPKKTTDLPATEKIEKAFWQLLDKEDYSALTVQKIADTARVNRNAVYYHYENIDDLAQHALTHFFDTEVVDDFMSRITGCVNADTLPMLQEDFMEAVQKIQLCAGSNSAYLHKLLKAAIRQKWFHRLGIDPGKIYELELLSIEFALSGIVAVLGSEAVRKNPKLMLEMPGTELGKSAIHILLGIAEDMKNR